jgi:hypothetical protein
MEHELGTLAVVWPRCSCCTSRWGRGSAFLTTDRLDVTIDGVNNRALFTIACQTNTTQYSNRCNAPHLDASQVLKEWPNILIHLVWAAGGINIPDLAARLVVLDDWHRRVHKHLQYGINDLMPQNTHMRWHRNEQCLLGSARMMVISRYF